MLTCMGNGFANVCYAEERKIMALVCLKTIGINMYGKWFCRCLLCRRKKIMARVCLTTIGIWEMGLQLFIKEKKEK